MQQGVALERIRIASAAVLLALTSCVNAGPRDASRTSMPADRAAIDLGEVVVTVHTDKGAQNLHVWFSILINPTERVNDREVSEVAGVLRRTEGRITAQATAELASRTSLPTASLGKVRDELIRAAQTTLDAAVTRWRSRDSFRIEAVITSIYFTNGSVGRQRAAERWW